MGSDQLARQRQAEATGFLVGLLIARAGETVEYLGLLAGGHSRTIVGNMDQRLLHIAGSMDQHPPPFAGILDRIVDDLGNGLAEPFLVGHGRSELFVQLQLHLDRFFLGIIGKMPGNIRDHLVQIDLFLGNRQRPGLALAEVENILDLVTQAFHRLQDRTHIFVTAVGQRPGNALIKQFGKAADRGQRRPEFVAHVGQEAALDRVRLDQRLVAFAQCLLDPVAVRNVEHGEQRIAIGQRDRGKFIAAAVGKIEPPAPLLAFGRRAAHHFAHLRDAGGLLQLAGHFLHQRIDPRMLAQLLFVQTPVLGELMVPYIQFSVGGKDRQRFKQIVEGRGPDPEQSVARACQLDLFGPVFENHQQPAVRCRVGEHSQMSPVGQQPVLLAGLGGLEPAGAFLAPFRKVADFRDPVHLAHPVEHPRKFGPVRYPLLPQGKNPLERQVAEFQRFVGVELRDAGGNLVEHVALRFPETALLPSRVFQFLDVDRIAGNAGLAERYIDNLGHPPFATHGGRNHPFKRLTPVPCPGRGIDRAEAVDRFHQLDPVGNNLFAVVGVNGRHIGAVDQSEAQVRRAVPHRHRRRLDQRRERVKGGARRLVFIAQSGDLPFAVGRIEDPQERAAVRGNFLVRQPASDQQRLVRTADLDRAHKAASGFLRQRDILHQRIQIRLDHAARFLVQFRNMRGQMVETEPVHQPLRGFQLAVGSHQQGQGGRGFEQAAQSSGLPQDGFCLALHGETGPDRPGGSTQPCRKNEAQYDGSEIRDVRH